MAEKLSIDSSKKIVTYPVRVIKRKNIGEFILFAALYSNMANWIVTQPPKNPLEIEDYESWKEFCYDNEIDIAFEAGTKVDFEELILGSDFCITTSIREGFGMAYLEPWLMGTPVIGRNIDYVTTDIKNSGILFPLLYDKLLVSDPSGNIDFKELTICEQKNLIQEIIHDECKRDSLFISNPFLTNFLDEISEEVIKKNRQVIQEKYSLEKYGERLNEIYQRLIG